jgi:pimeloyl-ACP methyl ester carboxylesterase
MFSVHCERQGKEIPLVFVHGFMMDSGMWKQIISAVPEDFPVYIIGLPGHFSPYTAASADTMDQMATALSKVLCGTAQSRFHLVGHSMGGYLAASLSRVNPGILASLCLFHSSAKEDSLMKKRSRDRAIEAIDYNKSLFCKSVVVSLVSPEHSEKLSAVIGEVLENALRLEKETLINALLAMRNREDSLSQLRSLGIPVAYIAGESDSRFPLESIQEEAVAIGAIQFSVLKSVAHMGHLESPRATVLALQEWFEKIKG